MAYLRNYPVTFVKGDQTREVVYTIDATELRAQGWVEEGEAAPKAAPKPVAKEVAPKEEPKAAPKAVEAPLKRTEEAPKVERRIGRPAARKASDKE